MGKGEQDGNTPAVGTERGGSVHRWGAVNQTDSREVGPPLHNDVVMPRNCRKVLSGQSL